MAQRIRTVQNVVSKENPTLPVKSALVKEVTNKRAALGEIGNEISNIKVLPPGKQLGVAVAKSNFEIPKLKEVAKENKNAKPKVIKKSISTPSLLLSTVEEEEVEDIDKLSHNDPFAVVEYVNDIYNYLRKLEVTYSIKSKHLEGQQVTSKMRSLLIDWLVEVQQQFHLLPETLYLTVSILDRYLQEVTTTTRQKLQLVGVGCMFVACKYEEMIIPDIGDFVYICDNIYTKQDILQIEMSIVKALQFNLSKPIPLHFLRRFMKAARCSSLVYSVAKYIMELSIIDYNMCIYSPSILAAASLFLALWIFATGKRIVWTKTLRYYTKYSKKELDEPVKKLTSLLLKVETLKFQAVTKKYAHSKFMKVSCLPELKSPALRILLDS